MRIERVDNDAFVAFAAHAELPLPIEQSPLWDGFDAVVSGRTHWRRLAVWGLDDAVPAAVVSLSRYEGRGFTFLWAKHGPVWIAEPTPAAERELREALVAYVAAEAPDITFLRLHAHHEAPDLRDLLQTVTYDRTVIVDLTLSEDERMAALSKSTRKKLRRALDDQAMVITDETEQAAQDFTELYAILEETAQRDGFGVFGPEVYQGMVQALAPAARVFVARRTDTGADGTMPPGRAVSWILCTAYDGGGVNYYSGQTAEGRATNVGVRLRWHLFNELSKQGVRRYDLMGVDSPRAPTLKGVGEFKRQFGPEVAIDGAWDVPVKALKYRSLVAALKLKRALRR